MRLLYVWARDNGVLSREGINLDTQYEFAFEEKNEEPDIVGTLILKNFAENRIAKTICNSLECEQPNILYTTAMAGNNGVGKTTVLKLLHDLNERANMDDFNERYGAVLAVYEDEKEGLKFIYLSKYNFQKKIRFIDRADGRETLVDVDRRINGLKQVAFLYYSSIFANEIESLNTKFDISTMGLMGSKRRDIFWGEEMKRQMRFIWEAGAKEKMPLTFLETFIEQIRNNNSRVMTMSIANLKGIEEKIRKTRRSNADREQDIYIWFVSVLSNVRYQDLYSHILRCGIVYDLCALTRFENDEEEIAGLENRKYINRDYLERRTIRYEIVGRLIHAILYENLSKMLEDESITASDCEKLMTYQPDDRKLRRIYEHLERQHYRNGRSQYFNNRVLEEKNSHEEQFAYMAESVLQYIVKQMEKEEYLERMAECLCGYKEYHTALAQTERFFDRVLSVFKWNERAKQKELGFAEAAALYDMYTEYIAGLPFEFEFLNFQWKMSAGEAAVLNFYARLYAAKEELNRYDNVVLLLDEPDVNLHPSLQQEYIRGLYRFVNTYYADKKVSIILSTHSPLLLSDIPKQNIIFMKRDDSGVCRIVKKNSDEYEQIPETFGANIISLYCNSFFLEEGSIGLFAKDVMKYVFRYLKSEERYWGDNNNIGGLIEIFGEPVLKQHAEEKYRRLRG